MGKWRVEVAANVNGKPVRRRVDARTKTEAYSKPRDLKAELGPGVNTSASDTVENAVEAWLIEAMAGRAAKTIHTQRELLDPLLAEIGSPVLRDLSADDVRQALTTLAATRTTRTVRDTRASLVRAITYTESHGKVGSGPPCAESRARRTERITTRLPAGRADRRPARSAGSWRAAALAEREPSPPFLATIATNVTMNKGPSRSTYLTICTMPVAIAATEHAFTAV